MLSGFFLKVIFFYFEPPHLEKLPALSYDLKFEFWPDSWSITALSEGAKSSRVQAGLVPKRAVVLLATSTYLQLLALLRKPHWVIRAHKGEP